MRVKLINLPYRALELENKKQNKNQSYYQKTINTLDLASNKLYLNQFHKNHMHSIRLNSANNSISKNKKNISQDKLKIYKNNGINNNTFYNINYQNIHGRPTSVKQKNNHFLYQKKRGIGLNMESNYYPGITFNSTNSQNNINMPFQKKRWILYEGDNELAEEYEKLRKIWKEAGVSEIYINNFETIITNQNNSKEEILQNLKNEEKQMIKFKEEILSVVSEIMKREIDIKNIKEINKRYLDIKTRININPKRNIKNNNFIKENEDKSESQNENDNNMARLKKAKELEEEKQKIEEELERGLNSL